MKIKKLTIFICLLGGLYTLEGMHSVRRTLVQGAISKKAGLKALKPITARKTHELILTTSHNLHNPKSSHFAHKPWARGSKMFDTMWQKPVKQNVDKVFIPSIQIATAATVAKLSWSSTLLSALATLFAIDTLNENEQLKNMAQANIHNEALERPEITIEVIEQPTTVMMYEENKREKAKEIKAKIDELLLACLGDNSTWDKKVTFAESVDLCLAAIKGNENLIDEWREIFFVNEPESWPKISASDVIQKLLEARDKNSTTEIGNILSDLFYLLPEKLQLSYPKLAYRLPCRLWNGHPGTKSLYVLDGNIFNQKEQELA